jgi:hypothetical protein
MKKFIFLLILAILTGLVSCNKAEEKQKALDEQNKVLVDSFITAIITGDVATMGNLMADNYKEYGPSKNDSATKEQVLENTKKAWAEDYAGIKYNRWVAFAKNFEMEKETQDWVFEWGDVNITHKSGAPPANFWIHGDFRVKDGKVMTYYAYYNVADILTQSGFKFLSPEEQQKMEKKKK